MNRLILVGGATGCGKTCFVDELESLLGNVTRYRRVQGFFDIAEERCIEKENIFKMIGSEEVDDYFVNKVLESDILISDVHYAIQMDRNSLNGNNGSFKSDYVPTLSDELINKLLNAGVKIYAVHITCDPTISYQRALERYKEGKRELRNESLEAAEYESFAEKSVWNDLCSEYPSIVPIELCSQYLEPKILANLMIDKLYYDREKKLKKLCYNEGGCDNK